MAAREELISRQQQELLELSTPVVKLWEGILALPIIGTSDSARTQVVMESLLQTVVATNSKFAIIDITGVPTVDTLVAQHLLKTITAARLMGAECIISGVRPQIAQTIVHLGINLEDVITKAKLSDAFALALQRSGRKVVREASAPVSPISSSVCEAGGVMERIPVLRMGSLLLITIQVDMHDKLALQLQDDVTERISEWGSTGVLIDISSLEIVDSFIGRMLANIAAMSRVLGADTVVVGMQPAVAITLVELGMSLPGVRTALSVEAGMELLFGAIPERSLDWVMNVLRRELLPLKNSNDVVFARQKVRQWAVELRFSLVDQTKLVTAASELARNALDHGKGGEMTIEDTGQWNKVGTAADL